MRVNSTVRRSSMLAIVLSASVQAASGPYLYMTDQTSAVDVVDARSGAIVKTIPVGERPTAATLSHDLSRLYVINQISLSVSVIDTRQGKVIAAFPLSSFPYALAVLPDDSRIYVLAGGEITARSAVDGHVIHTIPSPIPNSGVFEDIALSPDGSRLYASDYYYGVLHVYDALSCAPVTTVTGIPIADGIAVTPDGTRVFVISDSTLKEIHTATYTVSATITYGTGGGSGGQTAVVSPDGKHAYVTDDSNAVAAIDLQTYGVTRIQVPGVPLGAAVSANGSRLYVPFYPWGIAEISTRTNSVLRTLAPSIASPTSRRGFIGAPYPMVYVSESGADRITAINSLANTALESVSVGSAPSSIAVSPEGVEAYVSNQGDGTVSVVNAVGNEVMRTFGAGNDPVASRITPDGETLYVANGSPITVTAVAAQTGELLATIPLSSGGEMPTAMGMSPDGSTVYAVAGSYLCYVQTATNSSSGCGFNGPSVSGVATSPDGTTRYVTSAQSDTVSIYSPSGDFEIFVGPKGPTPVYYGPTALAVSPEGDYLYVTNTQNGSVSVIDTTSRTVAKVLAVAGSPSDVAVTPDGRQVYVANKGSGSVSVIDTTNNTVIKTIPGFSAPNAIGNIVDPFVDEIFHGGFE